MPTTHAFHPQDSMPGATYDDAGMPDLMQYWRSILRRKYSILALGGSMALLAGVIAMSMTPIYSATATIMLDPPKTKIVSFEDVYSDTITSDWFRETQVAIMKSRDVGTKAVKKMKLWENPQYDPRKPAEKSKIGELLESIGFAQTAQQPAWNEESLAAAVYGQFAGGLGVELDETSQLVRIRYESADPKLAAEIANTLANVYIDSDLDARYQQTQKASTWLQERLAQLKSNLTESERRLQEYRERVGIVDIKDDSQSGYGLQATQATNELISAKVRLAEAENAYTQIKNAKVADLTTVPAVLRNPLVQGAINQQSEAERRLAELSQRYGSEHPKYIQAESDVKNARENVRRQVDTVVSSVTREYQAALGTVRAIERTLNEATSRIQGVGRKSYELNVLQREMESNKQIFDTFLTRAKETSTTSDLQTPIARMIDPALPGGKIKPKTRQIVMVALLLGLFLGALIAILLDYLDNTIKTTADVEDKLRQPLLASVPLLTENDAANPGLQMLMSPQSLYSEAIRTARTGVLLSSIDDASRIVLVTSSVPQEGKSTLSTNLALAMAQTRKTLLIDADMRKPSIAAKLGLAKGVRGLSEYCSGEATLEQCIHAVKDSALAVIPTGAVPPNPLELLLSERFRLTLAELAKKYDTIIIDSPPLGLVSDASVLATLSTGVVYLVKAGDTPKPLIAKGLQQLRKVNAHVFGVVLNSVNLEHAHRYYGEYAGYGGKYGYAYQSDSTQ